MTQQPTIPQYRRFEAAFTAAGDYDNPFQAVDLAVLFTAPDGHTVPVDAFWDGGRTWRVRFAPDALGTWRYETVCSHPQDAGLHGQAGAFTCRANHGPTRFDRHGPVRLSPNRRYLVHADGTPFFWLADTAWNGLLLSTAEEWAFYLQTRAHQQFNAVQWVTTQWVAAPHGDREGQVAYTGDDKIVLNPAFFRRLDGRVDAIRRAGLLSVPVLLWAVERNDPAVLKLDPGTGLSEAQAARLARYMVARWGDVPSVWILNGDGDYRDEKAARWRHIGRAVFGERPHAPVAIHPGGRWWVQDEFLGEPWLDVVGYQSAHSIDDPSLAWLVTGPPATDWRREPARAILNLEPPYENHNDMARQGTQRIDAFATRRALYTSLLVTPTAGVSYGGHGVWGWDDGTRPPTAHDNTGIPLPWQEALHLPAAEQIRHLESLFSSIPWWTLSPAPELVLKQEEVAAGMRTIAALAPDSRLAIVYAPQAAKVVLCLAELAPDLVTTWVNPRRGERQPAVYAGAVDAAHFPTPGAGDWVLVLQDARNP